MALVDVHGVGRFETDDTRGDEEGKAARALAQNSGEQLAKVPTRSGVGVRDAGIAAGQRGPVAELPVDPGGARRGSTPELEQRGERELVSRIASPPIPPIQRFAHRTGDDNPARRSGAMQLCACRLTFGEHTTDRRTTKRTTDAWAFRRTGRCRSVPASIRPGSCDKLTRRK